MRVRQKKSIRISYLEVEISSLHQISVHGTVCIKFYPLGVDINLFPQMSQFFGNVSAWMKLVVHSCL